MNISIVQSSMMICFESVYLLFNTENIETLKNRFKLLKIHLPTLSQAENTEWYFQALEEVKDLYQKSYKDRPSEMPDYQIACVFKPSMFILNEIYATCISNCIARFMKKKVIEINEAKRQQTKKKRVEEALSMLDVAERELSVNCSPTEKQAAIKSLIFKLKGEMMILKMADNIN